MLARPGHAHLLDEPSQAFPAVITDRMLELR